MRGESESQGSGLPGKPVQAALQISRIGDHSLGVVDGDHAPVQATPDAQIVPDRQRVGKEVAGVAGIKSDPLPGGDDRPPDIHLLLFPGKDDEGASPGEVQFGIAIPPPAGGRSTG